MNRGSRKSAVDFSMLTSAEVQTRRVPIEEIDTSDVKVPKFKCSYCGRLFVRERSWESHLTVCPVKVKQDRAKTPTGIAAFTFYAQWRKQKGHGKVEVQSFMDSRFYSVFLKFSEFVIDKSIPNPEMYVELMISRKIDPSMWCHSSSYSEFFKWYTRRYHPYNQVEDTVAFLTSLSEQHGMDVQAMVKSLKVEQMVQYIRQRKISPWVFVNSSVMKSVIPSLDTQQKKILEVVLDLPYIKEASETEDGRDIAQNIKEVLEGLGL